MISHSEQVNEISAALAKAQARMDYAAKDAANPFFKSKYADLKSVWEACRVPLTENGLSILQSPYADGMNVTVTTMLLHSSGQWFRSHLTASAKKDDAQAIGSTITYLRRYSLQSLVGVAPEDDDGNASVGNGTEKPANQAPKQPKPTPKPTKDPELTAGEFNVAEKYRSLMVACNDLDAFSVIREQIREDKAVTAAVREYLLPLRDSKMRELESRVPVPANQ